MVSGVRGILIQSRDPQQVQWILSYYQIFKDLSEYAKNTFPHGLTWNPKGVNLKDAMKDVASKESTPSLGPAKSSAPVSYTHLTLPTICSV